MRQRLFATACACLFIVGHAGSAQAEPAGHNGNVNTEGKKAIPPGFITLPPVTIPLIRRNRVAGNLNLEIVLDATTGEAVTAATEKQSLLLAGYHTALSTWSVSFQDIKAPANVIAIKQQLQKVTDTVMGSTDAKVLLQSAMLRRRG